MKRRWLALLCVWLGGATAAFAQTYYPYGYGPQTTIIAPLPGRNWSPPPMRPLPPSPAPPPSRGAAVRQARFERNAAAVDEGVINAGCETTEGVFASESAISTVSYDVPSVPPVVRTIEAVPIPRITPVLPQRPGPYLVQCVENTHGDGQACYLVVGGFVWWMKDQRSPTLLTEDGLETVGGGGGLLPLDGDPRVGAQLTFGGWLNGERTLAIEASGFWTAPRSGSIARESDGTTLLARPFIDVIGDPSNVIVAMDGAFNQSGGARIDEKTRQFMGAEVNFRTGVVRSLNCKLDTLAGVRYVQLEEALQISTFTQYEDSPAAGVFQNAFIKVTDLFQTKNRIAVGQVGFISEWQGGPLTISLWNKTGVGVNAARTRIAGNTQFGSAFPAGVLALPTNSGSHGSECLTVIPELGVDIGLQLNRFMHFTAGYSFLYISDVYRPGEQIDRVLNPDLVPSIVVIPGAPPPFAPTFTDARTSFWAQGLNFQIELRW